VQEKFHRTPSARMTPEERRARKREIREEEGFMGDDAVQMFIRRQIERF
jgi:hypothetical protein